MEFENFYNENKDLFYRWAYSYTRNRETAKDVLQEASLIVYQRWGRIRMMENALGYYLRVIGNVAKKMGRKSQDVFMDDEGWNTLAIDSGVEEIAEARVREEWIYRSLVHLKEEERQILLLRDVEEMDFAEIAHQLGLNISTTKSHYRRAKLKLLKLWEENYGKETL